MIFGIYNILITRDVNIIALSIISTYPSETVHKFLNLIEILNLIESVSEGFPSYSVLQ